MAELCYTEPKKGGASMDILFQNKYTRTKDLAKEVYRFYYFRRKLLIVLYILLLLAFLANAADALSGDPYNLGILIYIPMFFALIGSIYCRQVKAMVQRDIEMHGKEVEVELTVTDHYIQHATSTGSVYQVEFDKFKRAIQTKNLILLHSKANVFYILRKDSFQLGTKEGFVDFLRTKGIPVKGK